MDPSNTTPNDGPQPTFEPIEPSNAPQSKSLTSTNTSKTWKQQTICAFWGKPKKTIKSKKNWRQQTLCYLWGKNFPLFTHLPAEIQRMVWETALPDPRTFRGGILYYVNFDLTNPQVLIPSIKELKLGYFLGHFDVSNPLNEWGELSLDESRLEALQRPILSLLHACRESRTAVSKLYTLDLLPSLPEKKKLRFCPNKDTIYFPTPHRCPEHLKPLLFAWMISLRGKHFWQFDAIRAIGLDLDEYLLRVLRLLEEQRWMEWAWEYDWLSRFLVLGKVVLVAHFQSWSEDDMKNPPTFSKVSDDSIHSVGGMELADIKRQMEDRTWVGFDSDDDFREVPVIEFWEVTRKSRSSQNFSAEEKD